MFLFLFFFSSRRRHTRWPRDWSSDVCSSDLAGQASAAIPEGNPRDAPPQPAPRPAALRPPTYIALAVPDTDELATAFAWPVRSEERRVGKECGAWLWAYVLVNMIDMLMLTHS